MRERAEENVTLGSDEGIDEQLHRLRSGLFRS